MENNEQKYNINDLTFITNDENGNLKDRFRSLVKDTRFFDVLVGYFYTSGFYEIYEQLENTEKIRILIGISTNQETYDVINRVKSHKEIKDEIGEEIKNELEDSENSLEVEKGLIRFTQWIKEGKLEIRAYPDEKIHSKLYIMTFNEDDRDLGRVITGSSNFTKSGLVDNLEFNVELKNSSDHAFAQEKFDELWEKSIELSEKYLETIENEYFPEDNVLLMLVEFGVANQYSKDLAADVKRGMRRKAQRGWYPGAVLPIGYMHNPQKEVPEGGDKIVIDPIRFPLVKRLWQLMGTGEYTLPQIYEKAQVLGLRNKKGKTFSINTIRNLFEKSFYAGTFHWRDENKEIFEVKGKHIKMITPKLFHRVQGILHGNSKPTRLNKQNIRYKGVIQCGNCFSSVCGDKKLQVICSVCKHKFSRKNRDSCPQCLTQIKKMKKPTLLEYTYYRCTRRRNNCGEVALKEEVLEKQITSIFENIKINEAYYTYLLGLLKESNKDRSDFKNQKKDFQRRIQVLDKKLVSYGDLRADNEITAEEYKKVKKRFSEEKMKLEKELRKLKYDDSVWIQDIDSSGKLMLKAKKVFQEDDDMKKNEVLSSFRSNLLVKQKKLYFPMLSTFSVIGKGFEVYSAYFGTLEPEKSLDIYRSFGVFNDLNAILLPD